jgi:hypothetical protein
MVASVYCINQIDPLLDGKTIKRECCEVISSFIYPKKSEKPSSFYLDDQNLTLIEMMLM